MLQTNFIAMNKNKKSFFRFVSILSAPFLFLAPALVSAQTRITISDSFPGKYGTVVGTGGPGAFIANFYQFALIIGGILAFGVIVYGGIKYMTSAGNPSGASEAKEWIEAALLGLLLLGGAYFILSVVNPQLLNLNLPALSGANVNVASVQVPDDNGGSTSGSPSSGVTGGRCVAPQAGPCTATNLQNTCLGSNSALAAGVCNVESHGANTAGGDLSTNVGPNGKRLPASVGLFQINLSANWIKDSNGNVLPCNTAFNHPFSGTTPNTTITNMDLYNKCVVAAQDAALNIAKACDLSKNGTSWKLWGPSTRNACGL